MTDELKGKKIVFLVAMEGIEQVELTSPWEAVERAGGEPVLAAPEVGKVQAFNHLDRADTVEATVDTKSLLSDDYDGVVLPDGVANPDQLRTDPAAVRFLKEFTSKGKPVAAICHGPWTLVEADVVRGKSVTSWPSMQTDIRNAGGEWRDAQLQRDDSNGYPLVTSRKPDDLDAFNTALVEVFAATGS